MITKLTRRAALASFAAFSIAAGVATTAAADGHKMTFTLATSGSETDARLRSFGKCFCTNGCWLR